LDGNSKFAKVGGLRSHASKHEFKTLKKSRCKTTSVWNTKQGYTFETKKFVNKRTTYRTSSVFNHSWREKRSGQGIWRDALVTKNDIQSGGSNLMYTQEKGLSMFSKCHLLFKNIKKWKIQGTNYYWWTLEILQV